MEKQVAQVKCIICLARKTNLTDTEIAKTIDQGKMNGATWQIPYCLGAFADNAPAFLRRQAD